MLRNAVVAFGILSLAGGAVLALRGLFLAAGWLLLNGLALTLGVLFERYRYKPLEVMAPGPGWQATGERFVDPHSGALVEVYFDPRLGERRYVRIASGGEGDGRP